MEFKKLGIATLVATGISLASTVNAQVINLDIDSSAEELVSSTFSFLPQRVRDVTSFSNVSFTGNDLQSGAFSTDGNTFLDDLGINSGIVLSTGSAFDAIGQSNTSDFTSTRFNNPGSDRLSSLVGRNTFDAATLSFDFDVSDNVAGVVVDFDIVFGSDEYDPFLFSSFPTGENNDIFSVAFDGVSLGQDLVSVDRINRLSPDFELFTSNFDGNIATEADGLSNRINLGGFFETGSHSVEFSIADVSNAGIDSFAFITANFEIVPGDIEPTPVPELSARGASLAIIFLISILLLMSENKKAGGLRLRNQLA